MEFEWDVNKAVANFEKHDVDFEDAIGVFAGAVLEVRSDRDDEERWKALGEVNGVVLAVIYAPRDGRRRIISARGASSHERKAYREAQARGT